MASMIIPTIQAIIVVFGLIAAFLSGWYGCDANSLLFLL